MLGFFTRAVTRWMPRPSRCPEASATWHYPTNRSIRDYQLSIVKSCLGTNCLVTLPTGLGKTYIASVTMFNFRRWYPTNGRIVFMAPTRPLVTQQMESFGSTVEVDQSEIVEMTGSIIPSIRENLWKTKRFFFLTPQVLHNDLATGICPGDEIVLMIIDEAHKATGRHAFCEVVRLLKTSFRNDYFRIVALTATPASSIPAIQNIIDNLNIGKIELRVEESIDVAPYVFKKEKLLNVVDLDDQILKVRDFFRLKLVQKYFDRLKKFHNISSLTFDDLSSYKLMMTRDGIRTRMNGNPAMGAIEGIFAALISLAHSDELIYSQGIVTFLGSLTTSVMEKGSAVKSRLSKELEKCSEFHDLVGMIKELRNKPKFYSHPKILHVEESLIAHFKAANDSRAIVFVHYRETVTEIAKILAAHSPLLRVTAFIGQASSGNGAPSFTQKQQIQALKSFRDGGYNVLVATCIGEEGLDIGGVDLVICYDAHVSPIRFLQRVGRTGRAGNGKIIQLLSRGLEENRYKQSLAQQTSVLNAIRSASRVFKFRPQNPDISPAHMECIKREFSVNHSTLNKKIERKPKTKTTSLPACFERVSEKMLLHLSIEPPKNVLPFWETKGFHSVRYNQAISLFKTSNTETESDRMSSTCGRNESPNDLATIMSRWRTSFTGKDLGAFFKLAKFESLSKKPATDLVDRSNIVKFSEIVDLIDDVPDDFFDSIELDSTPDITMEDKPPTAADTEVVLIDVTHDDLLKGDTGTTGFISRESTPLKTTPLAPLYSSISSTPAKLKPAPIKLLPMEKLMDSTDQTQTPLIVQGKRTRFVVSSSISPSPLAKKPNKSSLRHFIESQAAHSDISVSENDALGYSELGSFICDDEEEEFDSEEGSCSDGSESSRDMTSFYRQSLLQSQPCNGFDTASRFLRKPKKFAPSKLVETSSELSSTPQIDDCDVEFLIDDDINWDEIETKHLIP